MQIRHQHDIGVIELGGLYPTADGSQIAASARQAEAASSAVAETDRRRP
jgi:hypothetical protein